MKKPFLSLISIFALVALLLSGCRTHVSADSVLRNFLGSYPLPEGIVFSSLAKPTDREYADAQALVRLYGERQMPLYDSFAVYLYSDMDTLRECGVFVVRGGLGKSDDILLTQDMIFERIHLVSITFPQMQSRVMRFGNTVAYAIVPDLDRAERLFQRLTH